MDALSSDIQEEVPWCMLFADDIVLVGEDGLEVQSRLEKWRQKLENVGLKISRSKTEHMFCDFGGLSGFAAIELDGILLPVCSDFKYLGSLVQCDGDIDRDVKNLRVVIAADLACAGAAHISGARVKVAQHPPPPARPAVYVSLVDVDLSACQC
ncbi:uncharacterized protein LOC125240449 [Leguminivora glycinivorella]|uniref:uncharacterized protein LOC125240449 n=1 Tax=Leguminivora glycinivorella TaxID=1035111 RepID=UPI00200E0BE5|nr:uncharacterized protein LOC125240449 [Leguminivora glycinivorella]